MTITSVYIRWLSVRLCAQHCFHWPGRSFIYAVSKYLKRKDGPSALWAVKGSHLWNTDTSSCCVRGKAAGNHTGMDTHVDLPLSPELAGMWAWLTEKYSRGSDLVTEKLPCFLLPSVCREFIQSTHNERWTSETDDCVLRSSSVVFPPFPSVLWCLWMSYFQQHFLRLSFFAFTVHSPFALSLYPQD